MASWNGHHACIAVADRACRLAPAGAGRPQARQQGGETGSPCTRPDAAGAHQCARHSCSGDTGAMPWEQLSRRSDLAGAAEISASASGASPPIGRNRCSDVRPPARKARGRCVRSTPVLQGRSGRPPKPLRQQQASLRREYRAARPDRTISREGCERPSRDLMAGGDMASEASRAAPSAALSHRATNRPRVGRWLSSSWAEANTGCDRSHYRRGNRPRLSLARAHR